MEYNELKKRFDSNNKLKIRLYSLEYIIEKVDNHIEIYVIYYEKKNFSYDSFDELMNNYTVYNEPLIEQIDRIKILE